MLPIVFDTINSTAFVDFVGEKRAAALYDSSLAFIQLFRFRTKLASQTIVPLQGLFTELLSVQVRVL